MKKQKIKYLTIWKGFNRAKTSELKQKLRNRLIEQYYPLVKKIAKKMSEKMNYKVSVDELSSFGVTGLYVAVKKFKTNRGVRFEDYAKKRIQGSMIDGLRKEDIIPRSVRIRHSKFKEAQRTIESVENRKVLDEEVVEALQVSTKEYFRRIREYHPSLFISIDNIETNTVDNSEDFSGMDHNKVFIDKKTPSPENTIERQNFLSKIIGKDFSFIERQIILLYYYEDCTMGMVAKKLNISESRVSQIHKNLLIRMKEKIFRNPSYFSDIIVSLSSNNKNKCF